MRRHALQVAGEAGGLDYPACPAEIARPLSAGFSARHNWTD